MVTHSYSRQERINTAPGFKAILGSKQKRVSSAFVIYVRNTSVKNPRLGVIIQKKLVKRAVARNRIRRFIRESFRLNKQVLCHKEVVVIARHRAQYLDNQQLRQTLDKQWTTIGKYPKDS